MDRMNDTLNRPPLPHKIRIETPVGSIETMDDSPMIDGLMIILVFFAFCFFVYAKYFVNKCSCGNK